MCNLRWARAMHGRPVAANEGAAEWLNEIRIRYARKSIQQIMACVTVGWFPLAPSLPSSLSLPLSPTQPDKKAPSRRSTGVDEWLSNSTLFRSQLPHPSINFSLNAFLFSFSFYWFSLFLHSLLIIFLHRLFSSVFFWNFKWIFIFQFDRQKERFGCCSLSVNVFVCVCVWARLKCNCIISGLEPTELMTVHESIDDLRWTLGRQLANKSWNSADHASPHSLKS